MVPYSGSTVPASEGRPDKRLTEDDVVARLSSGMTIGIGGWGSRRLRAAMRCTSAWVFTMWQAWRCVAPGLTPGAQLAQVSADSGVLLDCCRRCPALCGR